MEKNLTTCDALHKRRLLDKLRELPLLDGSQSTASLTLLRLPQTHSLHRTLRLVIERRFGESCDLVVLGREHPSSKLFSYMNIYFSDVFCCPEHKEKILHLKLTPPRCLTVKCTAVPAHVLKSTNLSDEELGAIISASGDSMPTSGSTAGDSEPPSTRSEDRSQSVFETVLRDACWDTPSTTSLNQDATTQAACNEPFPAPNVLLPQPPSSPYRKRKMPVSPQPPLRASVTPKVQFDGDHCETAIIARRNDWAEKILARLTPSNPQPSIRLEESLSLSAYSTIFHNTGRQMDKPSTVHVRFFDDADAASAVFPPFCFSSVHKNPAGDQTICSIQFPIEVRYNEKNTRLQILCTYNIT